MSRLTRDGTAEPVSRHQFLGANGDKDKKIPVQLTTIKIGNRTGLIHTLLKVLTKRTPTLLEVHVVFVFKAVSNTNNSTNSLALFALNASFDNHRCPIVPRRCSQVIEFCAHYKEDPMNEIEKPLRSANMYDVVQEWYAKFVEVRGNRC